MNSVEQPSTGPDARSRTVEELLSALHLKFSANYVASTPHLALVSNLERKARALSTAGVYLEDAANHSVHQRELARCLDEVFGDSICAAYLSCCGMNVPARTLLRRSLELGLIVAAYWDSPVGFWTWREHDGDVHFTTLCSYLRSDGYKTLCQKQPMVSQVDCADVLKELPTLYGDLSNVVHPKPYNFSIAGEDSYTFHCDDFKKTLSYGDRVLDAIGTVLSARFEGLIPILLSSQVRESEMAWPRP